MSGVQIPQVLLLLLSGVVQTVGTELLFGPSHFVLNCSVYWIYTRRLW